MPRLCESQDAVLRGVLAVCRGFDGVGVGVGERGGISGEGKGENVQSLRQYNKSIRLLLGSGTGKRGMKVRGGSSSSSGSRSRSNSTSTSTSTPRGSEPRDILEQQQQPTNEQYTTTLTCCILFICLENIIGTHSTALQHLENGLRLLREWIRFEGKGAESEKKILVEVFRRLDMQATAFLNVRKPEMVSLGRGDVVGIESLFARACEGEEKKCFGSLEAAMLSLEGIEIRLFYTLTITSTSPHFSAKQALLSLLSTRFEEWKEAFDVFEKRASRGMGRQDLQLSLLLALHHQTTTLMLMVNGRVGRGGDSNEFRCELSMDFTRILELCRTLLNTSSSEAGMRRERVSSFNADMGIIPCLYFTALNAGDIGIRRRAVEILRSMPGNSREGFWDAGTVAGIAEKVLMLHPQGVAGVDAEMGIEELAGVYEVVVF